MFGLRYIKTDPSTYILEYRNGRTVREGAGLSFLCFAPSTSLVAVPLESTEAPFMFEEVSGDFQAITFQGRVSYRVARPKQLASLMNYTLAADGTGYVSEDPKRLPARVVNAVQVQLRSLIQGKPLQTLLRQSDELVQAATEGLRGEKGLGVLGLELVDLALLAVKPNPETARALEAEVREQILKQADDATYARRNAAIEQERAVKENELNTEIAVANKEREIRQTELDAERAELEKKQEIRAQDMAGRVEMEKANQALTELKAANARREADAKAYAVDAVMKALSQVDPKVLNALALNRGDASTFIAAAFQGLAENAGRIGQLNITPDLLQQLAAGGTAEFA